MIAAQGFLGHPAPAFANATPGHALVARQGPARARVLLASTLGQTAPTASTDCMDRFVGVLAPAALGQLSAMDAVFAMMVSVASMECIY